MAGRTSSTPTPTIGPRKCTSWGKMISAPNPCSALKRQGRKADQANPLHADHAVEQGAASRIRDREASEEAKGRDLRGIARKSDRRRRRHKAGAAGQLEQRTGARANFEADTAGRPEDHALKADRIDRILQPVDAQAASATSLGSRLRPDRGDVSPVRRADRGPQCRQRATRR